MKAKTRALAMPLDLTIRLRVRHLSVCLLLALALSVPALAETHKSKNGGRHDADISARLTSDLNKQERFKSVQASVEDGVVTLQGTVPLYVNKLDAEKRVKKQEHVTGVRNLITVAGASVPDSELREKLATKLRYDRIGFGIMFNNLTLSVHNGRATVGGKVRDYADRDSALALVATTPGVKDLIDDVEVASVSGFDDDLRIRTAQAIYGHASMRKYAIDPQAPIRIIVDRGKIELHGIVDSKLDKQIAAMQARSVGSAFEVNDYLLVKGEDAVR